MTELEQAIRSGRGLSGISLIGVTLSGSDLRGADLRGRDLSGSDLSGSDLSGTALRGCDFRGAKLRGVKLRGCDLRGAMFRGADLRGAKLRGADLRDADLTMADLRDADFRDADLRGAVFNGARVANTIWGSPTMLLGAAWDHCGKEDILLDAMRLDASFHPDPLAFDLWAQGGACPYEDTQWLPVVGLTPQRHLWSPGPAPNPMQLIARLLDACCNTEGE